MKLLHVGIGYQDPKKAATPQTIQALFGSAAWARYAPNCWVVYTNDTPKSLAEKVRATVGAGPGIFVTEINAANAYGYLQQEIWDWFKGLK